MKFKEFSFVIYCVVMKDSDIKLGSVPLNGALAYTCCEDRRLQLSCYFASAECFGFQSRITNANITYLLLTFCLPTQDLPRGNTRDYGSQYCVLRCTFRKVISKDKINLFK